MYKIMVLLILSTGLNTELHMLDNIIDSYGNGNEVFKQICILDSSYVNIFVEDCKNKDLKCKELKLIKFIDEIIPNELFSILDSNMIFELRREFIIQNLEKKSLKKYITKTENIFYIDKNIFDLKNHSLLVNNLNKDSLKSKMYFESITYILEKKIGFNIGLLTFAKPIYIKNYCFVYVSLTYNNGYRTHLFIMKKENNSYKIIKKILLGIS